MCRAGSTVWQWHPTESALVLTRGDREVSRLVFPPLSVDASTRMTDSGRKPTIALMLESDEPGGAEVFLLNCALELRERGYGVVPVLPLQKTGWLGARMKEKGFESETFIIKSMWDRRFLSKLESDLRRRGVTVIHSNEFAMSFYGTVIARRMGIRHVVTHHANMWMALKLRRRIALRWALRKASATVAVSEDFRQHLLKVLGRVAERVVTIPNGIHSPNGDAAPVRKEFGIEPGEVMVLAAGALIPRKGHSFLIEAVQILRREGCTVPLRVIIAGTGPEEQNLRKQIAAAGLERTVLLPGVRLDIPNLMAASDILAMPSTWEGMPLAVLEGMHAGSAIIGSDISGIPEAVRQGVDGLLTPPGDAPALAVALRRLLEDRELRERMGASALERAKARFHIAPMMDSYEKLYFARG
jgi:glycosyltransferase involved in cell wall biosynthesis